MKRWPVNIVLFLSFCSMVLVYYLKDEHIQNHVDYMRNSLSGAKPYIQQNSRINSRGISSDPVNRWEAYLIPRYWLAPAVLGSNHATDSTLLIFRSDADTSGRYIDSNTHILWEHRDSVYHYLLITRKHE